MSVHSLVLTGYNTKRVQNCAAVTQVTNAISHYNDSKTPNSPDTKMPRIPTIVFPPDELPRPAVIGLGGSNGSYKDSTTAIKEILASVLNIPSSAKSTLYADSDLENWEDSSDVDSDSDSDYHAPVTLCSQNDIRLARHKAAWDNPPITSTEEPDTSSPTDPITSSQTSLTELGFPSLLKCDQCKEIISTGSDSLQLLGPLNSNEENRRFSSPNLSSLGFNLNANLSLHNQPSEKCTFTPESVRAETFPIEDSSTNQRRSLSFSNILRAAGDSASTEALFCIGENLFEPAVSLEKENEHFLAADLFISVVERIKSNWQYEQWKMEGGMCWMRRDQDEPCMSRKKANSESAASVDSGYGGLALLQNSPAETIFEEDGGSQNSFACDDYDEDEFVVIELEDYEKLCSAKQSGDMPKRHPEWGINSAEQTIRNLYRNFRKRCIQFDREALLPARHTTDLLTDTNTSAMEMESSVSLVEEIKRFKMREKEDWSPPCFQVVGIVHPYVKRDAIVASQNYLCAGCGTKVEPKYTNLLRYCDYLGKYFCDCCHSYAESPIPGRILSKWNFGKYYVSNFAKSVLDKIWDSHQFDVQTENPELYKKVKDLNRVKEVQEQLLHVKKLVATCRFSEGVMKAFEAVPSHLTQKLHHFTLGDLSKIKQKSLLLTLRELLATAIAHVDTCVLCQAKGFICEFCQNGDVIFPFQTDSCRRCEVCKACYHKQCFKTGQCPKCARKKAREGL
ncbi:protein associated with UVRAG as autophagy enhancer [Gastrophryne carolinensis]